MGKDSQFMVLTIILPSHADCMEILGAVTSWSPKSLSQACTVIALSFMVLVLFVGGSVMHVLLGR
jgi:type II secretory pathway component PulF